MLSLYNTLLTLWKIDNYVLILLKMYGRISSNTSGNVREIVTVENSAIFFIKVRWAYMVMCMVTHGKLL